MRVAWTVPAVFLGVALALPGADARAQWGSLQLGDGKTTYACQSMDESGRVRLTVQRPEGGRDDGERYLDVLVEVIPPVPGFGGSQGPVPVQWRADEGAARNVEAEIAPPVHLLFSLSVSEFREWNGAERLDLEFAMAGEEITGEFDLTGFAEAAGEVPVQLVHNVVESTTESEGATSSQDRPPGASPSDPLLAGIDGVTTPRLIPSSKVEPELPKKARKQGLDANVILQATIRADGRVDDIELLRCNQPGYGFEEAAIEAVREWRYEPARKDGKPVAVYFTVFVEFKSH